MNSFIGSGCIWPEPDGEISAFTHQRLVGAVAGLRQQLLGLGLVVFQLEGRLAEPLMAGRHEALRRDHQAGEQLLHAFAVDREIGGLAHADVVPGRAFGARDRCQVQLCG